MKLKQIIINGRPQQNMHEIYFKNNLRILISYETPVAAFTGAKGYIRTEKKWSKTTSKHINLWLDGAFANIVPKSYMDVLFMENTGALKPETSKPTTSGPRKFELQ